MDRGIVLGATRELARTLFALLPRCAPNNAAPEEWAVALEATLAHLHRTADHVFRSVKEDSSFSDRKVSSNASRWDARDIVGDEVGDLLDLPPWKGINAGIERLNGCLQLLQAHLSTTSSMTLAIPVAPIWRALERILSVFMSSTRYRPDIRPEIEREERETLWSRLSEIHNTAITTTMVLIRRLGRSSIALTDMILRRLLLVFELSQDNSQARGTIYLVTTEILVMVGQSMPKAKVMSLLPLIHAACTDVQEEVVDLHHGYTTATETKMGSGSLLGLDLTKDNTIFDANRSVRSSQVSNALGLLETTLACMRPECVPLALRATIDRTVIIAQERDAMLASVLNPPRQETAAQQASSILPFLSRAYPSDPSVASLLRPRVPVIRSKWNPDFTTEQQDEDEDMPGWTDVQDSDSPVALANGRPEQGVSNPFAYAKHNDTEIANEKQPMVHQVVRSPKRPPDSIISWSNAAPRQPLTKRMRTDAVESANLQETVVDNKPIVVENGEDERVISDHAHGDSSTASKAKTMVQDDDGSERSITPELIIPSDLGASSPDEEDAEEEQDASM